MPVTVTIDPQRGLTITTGEGVVTDEEFLRAREDQLANRPLIPPSIAFGISPQSLRRR
jgi:hypothetical protein